MILVVLITTLLVSCSADVSHLETDLREDGYHYKKPAEPFPPQGNNGLAIDNQLQTDEQQQNSNELSPITTGSSPSGSVKPMLEYLPPGANQAVNQPSPLPAEYSTPSTYRPSYKTQPAAEYGSPTVSTTFAADSQGTQSSPGSSTHLSPSKPSFSSPVPTSSITDLPTSIENPASQPESVEQNQAYGAPPTATQGTKISEPKFPSPPAAPEREYLPPIENEIKSEQEPTYPQPSPTIRYPSSQPTEPIPAVGQDTNPEPSSTYIRPQSPYPMQPATPQLSDQSKPTTYQTSPSLQEFGDTEFTSPKISSPNSYEEPQPTYPTGSGPQSFEPKPAHKLGPDGYEYKIPSRTFEY